MILDAGAQALPTATCTEGGVCLTSSQTAPVTATTTTTVSIPFTTTQTSTTTKTLTQTTTAPATTTTVTETAPATTTTVTETAPATTTTVTKTAPPTTSTVTDTVTTGTTSTVTTTVFPTRSFGTPEVRAGVAQTTSGIETTSETGTTSGSSCGTPGTTTSLGNGEVETCGPNSGHIAVFATTPGVYNKIFDNTTSYYVSAGIFAPQYRFGFLDGCYYVPDRSSVADPGQTVTTSGTLTNAVAFGLHSHDVSNPIRVPGSACGGHNP
jgi:hypothetical protein